MGVAFPHVRTVIHMGRLTDAHKKPANGENAYYLCSRPAASASPERWLQLIRNHWGGCEIRNHWRKDAQITQYLSSDRAIPVPNRIIRVQRVTFSTASTLSTS